MLVRQPRAIAHGIVAYDWDEAGGAVGFSEEEQGLGGFDDGRAVLVLASAAKMSRSASGVRSFHISDVSGHAALPVPKERTCDKRTSYIAFMQCRCDMLST